MWAELDGGWCRSHHARWRQHGRPPTAEFIAHCVSYGEDRFDLRPLAPQLRLEIQYALQCRVDVNRTRTTPRSIKPLLDHLSASGVESLLDRPLEDWLAGLPAAAALHTPRAFLGYAIECLLDLHDGAGWDSEYQRDVWRLRRLGVFRPRRCPAGFHRGAASLAARPCQAVVPVANVVRDRAGAAATGPHCTGAAVAADTEIGGLARPECARPGGAGGLPGTTGGRDPAPEDPQCRDRLCDWVSACCSPAPLGIAAG